MSITLEAAIQQAIQKKLADGTVEKIIEEKVTKAIESVIEDIFNWNGAGKKAIADKMNEVIAPAIEKYDFSEYTVKLEAVLTELVNKTCLVDNKKILENFKELMAEPVPEKVTITDIFEKYKEYVSNNVDTYGLDANYEDGETFYDPVEVSVSVSIENGKVYPDSIFEYAKVSFSCEHDDNDKLGYTMELYRDRKSNDDWRISTHGKDILLNALKNMTEFEIYYHRLDQAYCKIKIDTEYEEDEVEPKDKPEWTLE